MTTFAVPLTAPSLSRCIVRRLTPKDLTLIVIGAGKVGSVLLDQIASQESAFTQRQLRIRVGAIANSRHVAFDRRGVDLAVWRDDLQRTTDRSSIEALIQAASEFRNGDLAIVDCTASAEVVDAYPRFIELGAHIVTPNKKANVLPWKRYRELMGAFADAERHFLYSANVGAGLPVLSTLSDLIASGDQVRRIEGILSGTLSYLFNRFDNSTPFSALVNDAKELGFTEPDPRVDLSGTDVAVKLLVLARQLGWKLDLNDVVVESLVLGDDDIARRYVRAQEDACALRYVATLADGRASAELECVPWTHPFANTRHTDNIVGFHTDRYCHTPLVIQGPGAGPEVTAGGVLADILRLFRYLPG